MTRDRSTDRSVRPLTEARLRRIAAYHLERWESSREGLRRVLLRRVDRAVRAGVGDREALAEIVARIVEDHVGLGTVDDRRYAEAAVRRARARGGSARKVATVLAAKGIDRETSAEALRTDETSELDAARAYARRRGLGAWRSGPTDPERARKDLAAMGRAGFGYDVARRALADAD